MSGSYQTVIDTRACTDADLAWYLDVINGFDYVAAVTRRCPNWIMSALPHQPDYRQAFDGLLTENGLLMQAEKIADYYRESHRFPRIALLDDVLVHGRGLNMFLQNLLELLAACLHVDEAESLLNDLCKSLTLFVLTANDSPVLLKQEYQWRMQFRNIARENEWRKKSYRISETIFNAETANTSYVISASLPEAPGAVPPDKWELVDEDEIPYRGARQRLYVHVLSGVRKAYPSVRSYLRGKSRYYTPYFFCPPLTDSQLLNLPVLVQTRLDADDRNKFRPFLGLLNHANKYEQRWSVSFQLINLWLGQVTLQRFLEDSGLNAASCSLDTEKIARNFGPVREIQPILDELCGIRWPESFLEDVCDTLDIPAQEPGVQGRAAPASTICIAADLAVYLQAVRHEAYAKSLESAFAAGRGPARLKLTGESRLDAFMDLILSALALPRGEHRTILRILAYLTQMMDRGDVCLKARVARDRSSGQLRFFSTVRNTEMSLSILPRKLREYFPHFVRTTQLYQMDDKFPERVMAYFFRVVPADAPYAPSVISTANTMAKILADYRSITDTLLDWTDVLPDAETSVQ